MFLTEEQLAQLAAEREACGLEAGRAEYKEERLLRQKEWCEKNGVSMEKPKPEYIEDDANEITQNLSKSVEQKTLDEIRYQLEELGKRVAKIEEKNG